MKNDLTALFEEKTGLNLPDKKWQSYQFAFEAKPEGDRAELVVMVTPDTIGFEYGEVWGSSDPRPFNYGKNPFQISLYGFLEREHSGVLLQRNGDKDVKIELEAESVFRRIAEVGFKPSRVDKHGIAMTVAEPDPA